MNGYTVITMIIICLVSACLMPTFGHRWVELGQQGNERIERLESLGRMGK